MKRPLHLFYYDNVEIICACGKKFVSGSTTKGPIRVEICSNCHPFFTGEKRLIDTEGRVERFTRQVSQAKSFEVGKEERRQKKDIQKTQEKKQKPLTLRELLQQARND